MAPNKCPQTYHTPKIIHLSKKNQNIKIQNFERPKSLRLHENAWISHTPWDAHISLLVFSCDAGAGPGFLDRGFICEKVGVRFADFISYFLNIPWKRNNLVSLRPNYFIFIGYLKTGGGEEGGSLEPPEPSLDPPLWRDISLAGLFSFVADLTLKQKINIKYIRVNRLLNIRK